MKSFGELIHTPETATGEALSKAGAHTPRIETPDVVEADKPFNVRIHVGPHPSTVEHSIRKLEVYFYEEGRKFNPILLASIELTPAYTEPQIELTLKLRRSGVLYVLAYCNLHGVWESRREIEVR